MIEARLYIKREDRNWTDAGAFRDVTDEYVPVAELIAARLALAGANDEIDYLEQQNDRFRRELGLPVEGERT